MNTKVGQFTRRGRSPASPRSTSSSPPTVSQKIGMSNQLWAKQRGSSTDSSPSEPSTLGWKRRRSGLRLRSSRARNSPIDEPGKRALMGRGAAPSHRLLSLLAPLVAQARCERSQAAQRSTIPIFIVYISYRYIHSLVVDPSFTSFPGAAVGLRNQRVRTRPGGCERRKEVKEARPERKGRNCNALQSLANSCLDVGLPSPAVYPTKSSLPPSFASLVLASVARLFTTLSISK